MRIPSLPRSAPVLAGILFLGLSACNVQGENISAPDTDDQKAALATAKPVALPPAILATKSYRCKDNSVVYIDWFSGDTQATVKLKKDAAPTMLKAPAAGQPMVADGGYALSGDSKASSIDVTLPGKDKQSCTG